MTEQVRPHPENPEQHTPEAGAGPLGLPPPDLEQKGEDGMNPERQPLLSALDILERVVAELRKQEAPTPPASLPLT
jgi:hypothetical protein